MMQCVTNKQSDAYVQRTLLSVLVSAQFDASVFVVRNTLYDCVIINRRVLGVLSFIYVNTQTGVYGVMHYVFVLLFHYANTPMQYTAIFHGCKNVNF